MSDCDVAKLSIAVVLVDCVAVATKSLMVGRVFDGSAHMDCRVFHRCFPNVREIEAKQTSKTPWSRDKFGGVFLWLHHRKTPPNLSREQATDAI